MWVQPNGKSVTGTAIPRLGNPAVMMLQTAGAANWRSRPRPAVPSALGDRQQQAHSGPTLWALKQSAFDL